MSGSAIEDLLRHAITAIDCRAVLLRVGCQNFETVYVTATDDGLRVSDEGATLSAIDRDA